MHLNGFIPNTLGRRVDCIFCRIISGKIPSQMLLESEHAVAILDAFPLAAGHTLVLSRRHCPKIQDMDPEENADLFATVRRAASHVDSAMTGASLIAIHNGRDAGQEIPHLHVHIVPRKPGDSAGAIHTMFDGMPRMSGSDMDETCAKIRGAGCVLK